MFDANYFSSFMACSRAPKITSSLTMHSNTEMSCTIYYEYSQKHFLPKIENKIKIFSLGRRKTIFL